MLFFLRQSLRFGGDRPTEERISFCVYTVGSDGSVSEVSALDAANTVRWLSETSRVKDPPKTNFGEILELAEMSIVDALRKPSDQQFEDRVRNVVWPIATVIVT